MAVFLLNICKFNGCGITFPSLGDLIQHIEDTHIDYDPKVVEQKEQAQPACLPLSYVLRFISDDARKESPFLTTNNAGAADLKRKLAIKHHSYSMSSSNRSNTPTGSEMDEDEMVVSESEDSNDSWTTEEFSSEFIMRYGSRHSGSGGNGTPGNEKPFACPVPGCKKRYKNVNGIKYHSKNGHKKDGKVRKGYKCHCGKSYKTAQGLKSHALVAHNSSPENVLVTQTALGNVLSASGGNAGSGVGVLMQRSSSPSQSLGSLSPSSISNMSSGASSCHGSGGGGGSGNGSQNILQHFSNTNHSNINAGQTVNCLAQAINGNGAATLNLQQQQSQQTQQQQQQQFNTTANNHQQIVTAAAVGGSLGTTLLNNNSNTIAAAANSSSLANATAATESFSTSFSFSGQLLATAMQQHQRGATTAVASHGSGKGAGGGSGNGVGINGGGGGGGGCIVGVNNNANCFYAATAPPMQTATLLPFSSSASSGPLTTLQQPQPPAISPTFIEHKYSANTFKEKFLANLRQNQQNVHNKLKSLNSSSASLSSSSSSSTTTQIMDNPESDSGSITSETSNVVTKNSIETENINDDNGDNDGNNYNDEDNNDHDDFDNNGSCGVGGGNGNTEGVLASLFNMGEGNPEKCSIQQQLNETMKNNLYKKTIN